MITARCAFRSGSESSPFADGMRKVIADLKRTIKKKEVRACLK